MANKVLICAIGAQGSIGTTIATGTCKLKKSHESVEDYLITSRQEKLNKLDDLEYCGWDVEANSFESSFKKNKPFKKETFNEFKKELEEKVIFPAPNYTLPLIKQIEQIKSNIKTLKNEFAQYNFIGVNLLPASDIDYNKYSSYTLDELLQLSGKTFIDLAYIISFIEEGIPFINFTPNPIELPAILKLAEEKKVIICGRDGKTGQTYWKVLLASGFAARRLKVEGWYSTNILGNEDGQNLNSPSNVENKIKQKSYVLDAALGYQVPNHIVRIDYYPPRADNKEAYDVIDYKGFLDEEMSMRVSLLCKDSILAAPLIIDMAIIGAHLQYTMGRSGFIPELALFFKYPLGGENLSTFQDQTSALNNLIG